MEVLIVDALGSPHASDGCLGTDTLSDFLEGNASPEVRRRVEQHASQCEECRKLLSLLARDGMPPAEPVSVPSRAAPLAAGAQVGRYVIDREIGAGGTGVVYAASDPELGRTVAVKVLRRDGTRDLQTRLRQEAQTMARLAHPNVVTVHDVGVFGDSVFMAMEYVRGQTLARWLATPRAFGAVLEVLRAAGRGLAAAHAIGIVHRDFKPENVLIGDDGRVCVGDFGLARSASALDPAAVSAFDARRAAESTAGTASSHPAVSGRLAGTPYYMAPELFRGAPADKRSDQFSFCVTLLTALRGARADDAATLDAVARAQRFRELAVARSIPRRVRVVLNRGLAADPAARFASLDALLDALAPPDRRVGWAAGGALLAGLAGAAWLGGRSPAVLDQRCTGAAAAYATTWSADRRSAVEAAFTASGAPFAAAAFRRVAATLDQYAARWIQGHTQTCRATRILGEQTETTLDLRMTCLERRRQEVAALIDTLAAADAGVVTRSAEAAAGLPDVATCADVAALQQVVAPPGGAATRVQLAALTPRLAEARARLETGSFAAGLAIVRPVAEEARALGYRPFEAEAALVQGELESELGDRPHAEASLEAAVLAAEAGRHDEIAARARSRLVFLVGHDNAEYARGLDLARFASAAIARLGGNAEIEAELEHALGSIDVSQSKLDTAIPHFESALALQERASGADHPRTAHALDGLGLALSRQGNAPRAVALFERALAIYERVLGPDHPLVARELHVLANAHCDQGNLVLAEQELRRALAIRETALGPDHPDVSTNLGDLARAVRAQGRAGEGLELQRRSEKVAERALGPEHPTVAKALVGLGISLGQMGHHAEAEAQLRRADAIFAQRYGPDHVMRTTVQVVLGDILIAQSQWQKAVTHYLRLLPALDKAQDRGDAIEDVRVNLALAYLELHQPARALSALRPLLDRVDSEPPAWRGNIRFMLARAIWDSGGDRERAHELATAARPDLVGAAQADEVTRIDHWLASHRSRRGPA